MTLRFGINIFEPSTQALYIVQCTLNKIHLQQFRLQNDDMGRRYTPGYFVNKAITKSVQEASWLRRNHSTSVILGIVYLVGVVVLYSNLYPDFILFTPFTLLFSLSIVLYCHSDWNIKSIGFLALIFSAGLGVEILGVQSGLIFGEYNYGEVLGPKIHGTPWMIGINWVMLIYCCGCTMEKYFASSSLWKKVLLGALLMVSLDILIEPVAVHYGFWYWPDGYIPMQNYLAWFILSCLFLSIFHLIFKNLRNNTAVALFFLQFLFFFFLGFDF